jgi:DNA primase
VHIYVRIEPRWDFTDVRHAAIAFGRELERRTPGVTTKWWKEERGERVFVDYNQNARDHTIAAAYSVRGNREATVSTPIRWDEVDSVEPGDFTIATVPGRFAELGDLHGDIDDHPFDFAPLLDWASRDEAGGAAPPADPDD